MKKIKARIESASLDDNIKGIYVIYTDVTNKEIDCESKKEDQQGVFVPKEAWGKIPADKNTQIELQKIVDILNGISRNGSTIGEIPNWTPKIINIEIN